LISLVTSSLNRGKDQAGSSIGEPTSFVVGCAVNLAAADLERECRLLHRKISSGAGFALSMPTYSADVVRSFRKAYEERFGMLRLPILVGVLPLVTARHAEFLHNELPGVSIPEDIRRRMHDAGKRGSRAGLEIAVELAKELRSEAAGLYVMPPFGRYDLAAEIVEGAQRI
jgi:homocysteine S-methyltransferase